MKSDAIQFETLYASRNPIYGWLTARFRATVEELLTEVCDSEMRIFDAGCGEGFVIRYLQALHPDIRFAALDINARRLATTKHLSPQVLAIEGNVYQLPLAGKTFDVVLANEILEHLEDPHRALNQISRVTRRYVICSAPREPFFMIGNLLRGAHWSRLGKTPAHVNFWSRRAFVRLLGRHFHVREVRSCLPWIFALCEVLE
jgi:ubiquinone/menaquinone biosynthesis C-methylase UbiE